MAFRAPVSEILFTLQHGAGLAAAQARGLYPELADGALESVLTQAARFGDELLAPLNQPGDKAGCRFETGAVTTPPGWRGAYARWVEGGWGGLSAPEAAGGMGLPGIVESACLEMWSGANMAFMLCPMLTAGAVGALARHGSPELRALYLPRLVSGAWSGTMNLTEPQAGSDLSALRCRAERAGDGSYLLTGQKIYITYGEHDLAENIVHLVLARLPDAPAGTRGISMFLVPKILPDGARNDVRCGGVEHKMGIHASPTCTMIYGDAGGARGWLVGEENRGLACMFTMMNAARLGVGLQGVGIAEAATQKALAFAAQRRQGRPPGWSEAGMAPIIHHADVRRMLLTMRALTLAARAICFMTSAASDLAQRADAEEARSRAAERASLLTPVAKAFATDVACEVASLGVQVHGGMGYIEETGAAQFLRDARITAIYEGTNGIQAIDLVTRKLPLSGGACVAAEIADMRASLAVAVEHPDARLSDVVARVSEAVDALERATLHLVGRLSAAPDDALAGATPYLRLFALARGGAGLATMAHAACEQGREAWAIPVAHFFAQNICPAADGLARVVIEGAGTVRGGGDV